MTVQFRIADTIANSLAGLTNDEQKAVKTTAPISGCNNLMVNLTFTTPYDGWDPHT